MVSSNPISGSLPINTEEIEEIELIEAQTVKSKKGEGAKQSS